MKVRWQTVLFALDVLFTLLFIFSAFLGWLPVQYSDGFLGFAFLLPAISQLASYRKTGRKFDLVYSLALFAVASLNFFAFLLDIGLLA